MKRKFYWGQKFDHHVLIVDINLPNVNSLKNNLCVCVCVCEIANLNDPLAFLCGNMDPLFPFLLLSACIPMQAVWGMNRNRDGHKLEHCSV